MPVVHFLPIADRTLAVCRVLSAVLGDCHRQAVQKPTTFSSYPSRRSRASDKDSGQRPGEEGGRGQGVRKSVPRGCVNEQLGLGSAGPRGNFAEQTPGLAHGGAESQGIYLWSGVALGGTSGLPHKGQWGKYATWGDICPTFFTHPCAAYILEMYTPLPRHPPPSLPALLPSGGVCTGGHPLDPHPVLQQQNRL